MKEEGTQTDDGRCQTAAIGISESVPLRHFCASNLNSNPIALQGVVPSFEDAKMYCMNGKHNHSRLGPERNVLRPAHGFYLVAPTVLRSKVYRCCPAAIPFDPPLHGTCPSDCPGQHICKEMEGNWTVSSAPLNHHIIAHLTRLGMVTYFTTGLSGKE